MSIERLAGWGRATTALSQIRYVDAGSAGPAVLSADGRGVLARGLGRSYGDAALNSGGQVLRLDAGVTVDPAGRVTAAAGATFEQLLRSCLPHGWTLPVLPGTRHLTIGGAVAADVHGKNHPRDGSLGRWIEQLTLTDGTGASRQLGPDQPAFWATVGGMGLTGVITSVTLRLLAVQSSWLEVDSSRCRSLDVVLDRLGEAAAAERWAVAWVDGLAAGAGRGRGIVSAARVLPAARAPGADPLSYRPPRARPAPRVPRCLVTPLTARGFNTAWWVGVGRRPTATASLSSYFHQLDRIGDWNRLYGPKGFLQYQFVVPVGREDVLGAALERLAAVGGTPFLGVLKRFGPAGRGLLSFPRPGWSLAVDLPPHDRLAPTLDRLDRLVADAGGAVYLAKDARLRSELVPVMYPRLEEWRKVRDELDPEHRMQSDLSRRLGLVASRA